MGGVCVGGGAGVRVAANVAHPRHHRHRPLPPPPQALGPRAIPTPAAVAAELALLGADEEGESEGESEGGSSGGGATRYQTALAKDPPDYFGFVG